MLDSRARLRARSLMLVGVVSLALAACQSTPTTPAVPPPPANPTGAVPDAVATMKARAQPAPAWMIGKFTGTSLRTGLQNIEIEVAPTGLIRGRIGDLVAQGQYIGNSRIFWAHGNESLIEQRGTGFRVVQLKDPANVIEYQRNK